MLAKGQYPLECWWVPWGNNISSLSYSLEEECLIFKLRLMNINNPCKIEVGLFPFEKDQWYVKWLSVHLILMPNEAVSFCFSILPQRFCTWKEVVWPTSEWNKKQIYLSFPFSFLKEKERTAFEAKLYLIPLPPTCYLLTLNMINTDFR